MVTRRVRRRRSLRRRGRCERRGNRQDAKTPEEREGDWVRLCPAYFGRRNGTELRMTRFVAHSVSAVWVPTFHDEIKRINDVIGRAWRTPILSLLSFFLLASCRL